MRVKLSAKKLVVAAMLPLCMSGCHLSQGLTSSKEAPIYQNQPLPPLDYLTLSGGKITHYVPSPTTPNDPVQEATLEACRELPIKGATARSATVVIEASPFGKMPVAALIVGNTTLVSLGQVLRALRTGTMNWPDGQAVLYAYSTGSIKLTPKSKFALVGNKTIPLRHPIYRTERNHDLVITLSDLLFLFHERDVQRGDGEHTIQSAEVSYEPDASKLYSAPR